MEQEQQDANGAPLIGTPEIHRMLAEDRIREEQYKIMLARQQEELKQAYAEISRLRAQSGENSQGETADSGNVTPFPNQPAQA